MSRLREDEWWAVCHAHNGKPCCSEGRAALFDTRRQAEEYRRRVAQVIGSWNLRIRKVVVR